MSYLATIKIPSQGSPADVHGPFPMDAHRPEFELALVPNWDGRDARPLEAKTIADATALLTEVGAGAPSEVAPGRAGSLAFVWEDGANYAYCDVGPGNRLHVHHRLGGRRPWEAVSSVGDRELVEQLRKAMWAMRRIAGATRSYSVPGRRTIGYVQLAAPR